MARLQFQPTLREAPVMVARYTFWVIGILSFGWWGAVAVMRPESLDAEWLVRARRLGVLPDRVERHFRSHCRRTEVRIGGAIALAISAFLLSALLLHLAGRVE